MVYLIPSVTFLKKDKMLSTGSSNGLIKTKHTICLPLEDVGRWETIRLQENVLSNRAKISVFEAWISFLEFMFFKPKPKKQSRLKNKCLIFC